MKAEERKRKKEKKGRSKNEEEDRKIEKLVTDKILHVLKKYDLGIKTLFIRNKKAVQFSLAQELGIQRLCKS